MSSRAMPPARKRLIPTTTGSYNGGRVYTFMSPLLHTWERVWRGGIGYSRAVSAKIEEGLEFRCELAVVLFPNCVTAERRFLCAPFCFSMRWHFRATQKVAVFSTVWLVSLVDGKLNFHARQVCR